MLMMITMDLVLTDLMMIYSMVRMMIYTVDHTTEEDSVDTTEDTEGSVERVERVDTEEREEKEERVDTTAVMAMKLVKSFVKLCTTIRFLSLLLSPFPLYRQARQ